MPLTSITVETPAQTVRSEEIAENEVSMVDFVSDLQRLHQSKNHVVLRKTIGQYFTPPEVSRFMAGLFTKIPQHVRILDPGAGAGILSAAICERIFKLGSPRTIELVLYETDPRILPLLKKSMYYCKQVLENAGCQMRFTILANDFVLENCDTVIKQSKLDTINKIEKFDLIIMNPPYYKLRKNSEHAKKLLKLFKGQPNIYAQFMAIGAGLLTERGQMVAITPRSYCNGLYFKGFRNYFLNTVKLTKIHIFESRETSFESDGVLQENTIIRAERISIAPTTVDISVSNNHCDLSDSVRKNISTKKVFYKTADDIFIRIFSSPAELAAAETIDSFDNTFTDLGYKISTGPIVAFRQKRALTKNNETGTVPLISIRNVQPFEIVLDKTKQTYFKTKGINSKFVIPYKSYVLIRRFTAKEDQSRLLAAVLKPNQFSTKFLAFENHINYIYKANGELTEDEAYGLAGLFNSRLYDSYFRALSGNTQVNANEIKYIKLPPANIIKNIGNSIKSSGCTGLPEFNQLIQNEIDKLK